MKTFYITTPIYYANSLPHLGHFYTTTVADVIAKHKKQLGFDTYFLTGTDEHGVNIQRVAEAKGETPKQHVDYISGEIKKMFGEFGLTDYDVFMRTSEPFHYEGVSNLWREIAKNKTPKGNENIYKGFYEAWFCPNCAEFKTETEYEIRSGEDVPRCLIHERFLDKVSEESYFFRLSDYDDFLLETIENDPHLIRPEARRNEVVSFIKSGLQDLSISREKKSVSWGIPVPDDANHVMYVWLDALSNYITAIGYGNDERGKVGFEKYWQNVTHLVGKDILRQHTVYWFSFLKAANLDLPKTVYAHGMWLDAEGRKMGKTLGNVIELDVLKQHFQTDAIRYFILREMVFGQDGKFGYENLIDRTTADLANGLGNFSSRTLSMINKYRDGIIPDGTIHEENFIYAKRAKVGNDEQELASVLELARNNFLREFDNYNFSEALEAVWAVISKVDKIITESAPWNLYKSRKDLIEFIKTSESNNAKYFRTAYEVWATHNDEEIDLLKLDDSSLENATDKIFSELVRRNKLGLSDEESDKLGEEIAERFAERMSYENPASLSTQPLLKSKADREILNAILYRSTETLRWLCVLLYPVMPDATTEIYRQIGLSNDISKIDPKTLTWGELQSGNKIGDTKPVFPRVDKTKVMNEIMENVKLKMDNEEKKANAEIVETSSVAPEAVSSENKLAPSEVAKTEGQTTEENYITIDDFLKVELKVGEIKVAERIPKADKLLRFEIDLGEEKPRQILAGLAEYYEPETLVGRKVVVVANLKPRMMRGLESQGMICAASLEDGTGEKPALAAFIENVDIGARLK